MEPEQAVLRHLRRRLHELINQWTHPVDAQLEHLRLQLEARDASSEHQPSLSLVPTRGHLFAEARRTAS